jgi:flagellar assembly protein FliH
MKVKAIISGVEEGHTPIVVEFRPREFFQSTSGVAQDTFDQQNEGSDFHLSEHAAIKAGIDRLQKESLESKIDDLVLERLKEVQEKAYQEAYQIGLKEGRTAAQTKAEPELLARIAELTDFVERLKSLLPDVMKQYEAAIIRLLFQIAKRIAYKEISMNPEMILNVLNETVGGLEADDRIVVFLSPEDKALIDTIEDVRAKEILTKIKIEETPKMKSGGCLIETLHGMTDATIEERVTRVWANLEARLPKRDEETQ